MVELVVTMIIIGIMAVVAVPRFSNIGAFDARGAGDQVAAYLRFAQKSALAQRRYVSISGLASTSAAPILAVWPNADCATGTSTPLSMPTTFRTSTQALAAGTNSVCFDTLGGATATATITFSADGSVVRTVTVHAVTGFIHAS